jgi:hypothetical protein
LNRADEIFPFNLNRYEPQRKSAATPLDKLVDGLEAGSELLLSFRNEILGIDEIRRFKALAADDERPKANTIVLIRHLNQWIVGKYAWSKQRDSEGERVFYLVSVRGFSRTQKFEIEEKDWEAFQPRAMESIA